MLFDLILACLVLLSSVQIFSEEVHDYMNLAIVDNTRRYDSLPVERQPTGIIRCYFSLKLSYMIMLTWLYQLWCKYISINVIWLNEWLIDLVSDILANRWLNKMKYFLTIYLFNTYRVFTLFNFRQQHWSRSIYYPSGTVSTLYKSYNFDTGSTVTAFTDQLFQYDIHIAQYAGNSNYVCA